MSEQHRLDQEASASGRTGREDRGRPPGRSYSSGTYERTVVRRLSRARKAPRDAVMRARNTALAGQSFASRGDIAYATTLATNHLNNHASPWVWGRPAPPIRQLRRRYTYTV